MQASVMFVFVILIGIRFCRIIVLLVCASIVCLFIHDRKMEYGCVDSHNMDCVGKLRRQKDQAGFGNPVRLPIQIDLDFALQFIGIGRVRAKESNDLRTVVGVFREDRVFLRSLEIRYLRAVVLMRVVSLAVTLM